MRPAGDLLGGAAVLRRASGIKPHEGHLFTVSAPPFTQPLRNPLRVLAPTPVPVRAL